MKRFLGWSGYWVGAISLAAFVGLSVGGANRPAADVIVASKIILVDDAGKTRVLMSMTDAGPTLSFYDSKGRSGIVLNLSDTDATAFVRSQVPPGVTGGSAVMLRSQEDGKAFVAVTGPGNRTVFKAPEDRP